MPSSKNKHQQKNTFKFASGFIAAALMMSSLSGCSNNKSNPASESMAETTVETTDETTAEMSASSVSLTQTPSNAGRVMISSDEIKINPAELGMYPEKEYSFPYLGMDIILPDSLFSSLKSYDTVQFKEEISDEEGLSYAFLSWSALNSEQKNTQISMSDAAIEQWKASLLCTGTLGIYRAELSEKLDTLTGCDDHQKLGESSDGAYVYYLSLNSKGDPALSEELKNIKVTLNEMEKPEEEMSFFSGASNDLSGNIGSFSTEDIYGNPVDQSVFQDYDLTLVNVFTTWCSPCVEEIPELEKLREQVLDDKVGVITVVMDTVNSEGKQDDTALEKAKILAQRSDVQFPMLIPDATLFNGLLDDINTVPQTFFIDKDGNLVGETYLGAHDLEEWKTIVEKELSSLKEAE